MSALGRIDPATLYPAVLAGSHAWIAWGLTRTVDHHRVELLVPSTAGSGCEAELAERFARQLHRPVWPEVDGLEVTIERHRVTATDHDQTTIIALERRAWYPPRNTPNPPGDTVTFDSWPILDEASALRDRAEAIARNGPDLNAVRDLAAWAELKLTQARDYPSPTAPTLDSLLGRLHREASDTYPAITRTIDHARTQLSDLPDRQRIAATYQQLVLAQQRIAAPARRRG